MTTPATTPDQHRWLNYTYAIVFIAGLGFFALSFFVLAVRPGYQLEQDITARAPSDMPKYSAAEVRGREIYGREGCAYCHTQQVRFVAADVARWGAPTEAWETKYDYPQLWGTRRIGPDLAREAGVRPNDWHLTHLYNPRLIVRDSVMPGYPWLFRGGASAPTAEALDLLAYLQTLGRARLLSGYDQAIAAGGGAPRMGGMSAGQYAELAPRSDANATQARQDASTPRFAASQSPADVAHALNHGSLLFAANCAGCHGRTGAGDGPASATLQPKPANLRTAQFAQDRISAVLWNGVTGTSMPAWRDLPQRDLQDLVAYVSSLHAPQPAIAPAQTQWGAGALVFAQNCVSCHGATGAGDGPAGRTFAREAANFHLKQPDVERAREVLQEGIPGTSMPAWTSLLSDAQRDAVIVYLRSLYGTPSPIGASNSPTPSTPAEQ